MKKQMNKQILDELVKPLLNQTAPETQLFLDSLVIYIYQFISFYFLCQFVLSFLLLGIKHSLLMQ